MNHRIATALDLSLKIKSGNVKAISRPPTLAYSTPGSVQTTGATAVPTALAALGRLYGLLRVHVSTTVLADTMLLSLAGRGKVGGLDAYRATAPGDRKPPLRETATA